VKSRAGRNRMSRGRERRNRRRAMWKLSGALAGVLWLLALGARPSLAAVPAFPGAEGPGATAMGGRGGDVYHVTKLDADKNGTIVGSLQYGINNAPAAGRTIVFDVGGTIYLAGQSANDSCGMTRATSQLPGRLRQGWESRSQELQRNGPAATSSCATLRFDLTSRR